MMRVRVAILAAMVVFVAATPLAAADHPTQHFTPVTKDLGPGESFIVHPEYQDGPLREDWVFLIVGGVIPNGTAAEGSEARLTGNLTLDGETVMSWDWASEGGAVQFKTKSLPATSEDYEITVTNPGDEAVRAFFYFDQTCNCIGKPLTHFPVTWSMFNFDYYAGETVWMDWKTPEGTNLAYQVLTRTGDDGVYPEDFEEVAQYPRDALENGTITWDVEEDQTYYFLVKAAGGQPGALLEPRGTVASEGGQGQPVDGGDGAKGKSIPAPGVIALIAAAGAVAVLTLPRARRGRPPV